MTLPTHLSISQKIRERKNDILRGLFHDIRTPLASVKEASSLLWEEILGPLNESQKKCADIARNEILKIQKGLDPILELSFLETDPHAFSFEWIPLGRVLDTCSSVLETGCAENHLHFKKSISPCFTSIYLDLQAFQKAFQNLSPVIFENATPQTPLHFVLQKNKENAFFEIRCEQTGSDRNILQALLTQDTFKQKELLKKSTLLFSKGFLALSLLDLLGFSTEASEENRFFSVRIVFPSSLFRS